MQLIRLEPFAPIALGVHGIAMLSLRNSQFWQWGAVGAVAALGLLGLFVWRGPRAANFRALCILALAWPLMFTTGGTGSFFLLWYFALISIYPLVLDRRLAIAIVVAAPTLYASLLPLSAEQIPLAVVAARVFLILFIGLIIYQLGTMVHRHMAQLELAVAELSRLYLAAQDLSATLEPQIVLEQLAKHFTEALNTTSGYILQVDLEGATIRVLAEYWSQAATQRERKSDFGRTYTLRDYPATARAVATNEFINLQVDDPDLPDTERGQLIEYGAKSALLIPLVTRGRVVGEAELWDSIRARVFTKEEIRLARLLAGHAASIIENTRLYAETRQRQTELTTLLDVAQAVSSSLELEEVLKRVTNSMTNVLHMEHCAISDYDPATRSVRTLAVVVLYGQPLPEEEVGRRYSLSDYPTTAHVIESGQAKVIRVTDPQADPAEVALAHHFGRAALLMLPLRIGNRPVGLAELYTADEHRELTPREIQMAQALADQAAMAIENARLFEALQYREEYFRALVENASEGIAILDGQGAIRYQSPFIERILGYKPEDFIGRQVLDSNLIHPDDLPLVTGEFLNSLQTPGATGSVEIRIQHKDGRWLNIEVAAHNLLDNPRVTGVVLNYRDITERKQAEESLRRWADELEVLAQVASALRQAQTRETMLPILVEVTTRLFRADTGALLLLEGEALTLATAHKTLKSLVGLRQPPDEGLVWRTIRDGQLTFISDTAAVEDLVLCELCEAMMVGMRACACIPLKTAEATVGLLFFASRTPRTPTADEIRLLTAIAEMGGAAIHRTTLHEQTERYAAELALAYDSTLEGWARALELRDEVTEGHTRRVTELTLRLARTMGLAEAELIHIRRGALLHDIGKMGISDTILLKAGPLSTREEITMRLHPEYAYAMLSPITFLRPALDIPYYHHEKWDGTGYPCRLQGEQIPLAARIFAIADVWDALTSDRPYRPAWPLEKVLDYIREQSGRHFDPRVTDVFLQIVSG